MDDNNCMPVHCAICAITMSKPNSPVQTAGSALAGTTTIYNDTTYVTLVTADELAEVGLPETITDDIIGKHVAYLELSGDVADYIETEEETDIELYTCTAETTREVYILHDGDAYWPVAKIE